VGKKEFTVGRRPKCETRGKGTSGEKGTIDSVDWNGERQTLETLIQFVKFVLILFVMFN